MTKAQKRTLTWLLIALVGLAGVVSLGGAAGFFPHASPSVLQILVGSIIVPACGALLLLYKTGNNVPIGAAQNRVGPWWHTQTAAEVLEKICMPVHINSVGVNSSVLFCNQDLARFFGISRDQLNDAAVDTVIGRVAHLCPASLHPLYLEEQRLRGILSMRGVELPVTRILVDKHEAAGHYRGYYSLVLHRTRDERLLDEDGEPTTLIVYSLQDLPTEKVFKEEIEKDLREVPKKIEKLKIRAEHVTNNSHE